VSAARGRSALGFLALAAFASCGREKVTALDLQIDPTGSVDQLEIKSIVLGGMPLSLGSQETFFPMPPRLLNDRDVLTLWFLDSDDGKSVSVIVQGYRCGVPLPGAVTSESRQLEKGSTVTAPLVIAGPDLPSCDPTGAGGRGGGAGGGAAGGAGGSTG
jgi:hypothetical protein